ncbi:MAG: hypothetical protein Q4E57_05790 [Eubacteriales bacterium]|nr:hypothetical protein [Eubacteriales bacterium]
MSELKGLDVIKAYRTGKTGWLPMRDKKEQVSSGMNEYDEYDIGWNAGVIDGNRPYFVECWHTSGITTLTIYVTTKDLGDLTHKQLADRFVEIGYYTPRENAYTPEIRVIHDDDGNEYLSINIVAIYKDEPYIEGGAIYDYYILNKYNRQSEKPEPSV